MASHVFGPVPSRRLGRSLGIDLVPFKTCTYDCIYCQLGRTTCKTVRREEYVPLTEILTELKDKLASTPDFVTLSGSGEPTLYSELKALIRAIKGATDVPVAVLTNGSLLWLPEVREGLLDADLVIPSLGAGSQEMFQRVNRPHEAISFEQMVEGLVAFRQVYEGRCWLEVLLVGELTGTEREVAKIARLADRIEPDRVQLNTVTRPPADPSARAVSSADMAHFAALFGPRGEVIADYQGARAGAGETAAEEPVLDLLRRRPCTVGDVAAGLGIHRNEAIKHLNRLIRSGLAHSAVANETRYYVASGPVMG